MAARDRETALDRIHLRAVLGQAVVSAMEQEMTKDDFVNAAMDAWIDACAEILVADAKSDEPESGTGGQPQ